MRALIVLQQLAVVCLLLHCTNGNASEEPGAAKTTWSTDDMNAHRFLAVHGRRAVVMGYPEAGLEVWAYPVQVVSNYQVDFISAGHLKPLNGSRLLRRTEYRPHEITRVYVGEDFVVREHIFVPLEEPGAIFTYEVAGKRDVSIRIQFHPSLNLMWPGTIGGQSTQWNDAIHGYVLEEPLHRFSAAVVSEDSVGHDPNGNSTIPEDGDAESRSLVLNPHPSSNGARLATVAIGYDTPKEAHGAGAIRMLAQLEKSEAEAIQHYDKLFSAALQIETPDPAVNQALRWSVIALDQAWVCNPDLGCGEVAGYGPSRLGRRPQYDWFFAGDGLVATDAMIAAGEYEHARDELAFITGFQNHANGMIWHELSQSAGVLDWQKYPYMYVHVDISFDYLQSFAHYVRATGDITFLKANWQHIDTAYKYCLSLVDPDTGLPKIPAGQEGGNEQERMQDDLALSVNWFAASSSFGQMARLLNDNQSVKAEQAAERASDEIARVYWDPIRHFTIAGHTLAGRAIYDQRPTPSGALEHGIFTAQQSIEVLDQLASPAFQTDWGTRSMSSLSANFDPDSYAAGSVSALTSAHSATMFWKQHRPLTGWQVWNSLVPWSSLDSPGHIHEVLAGDFYHPQAESVPEQTWSSAGFLDAAISGLLGLEVEMIGGAQGQTVVTFAPHLPAQWEKLSVAHVRAGESSLSLKLSRDSSGIEVEIDNSGSAVPFIFEPEVPLGAEFGKASIEASGYAKSVVVAELESHDQDEHARVSLVATNGKTLCRIPYVGGVTIGIDNPSHEGSDDGGVHVGDQSRKLKLVSGHLDHHTLTIDAFAHADSAESIVLRTPWKIVRVKGGSIDQHSEETYIVRIKASAKESGESSAEYRPVRLSVEFEK
jgi:hypothetical protein